MSMQKTCLTNLMRGNGRKRLFLPFMACLLGGAPLASYAMNAHAVAIVQQHEVTIKGRVLDSHGEPVVGASVVVKGEKSTVYTDSKGWYQTKAKVGSKVTVSYLGMRTQAFDVKEGVKVYDLTLEEQDNVLDQAVVVGYATQRKVNLTGSVASVDAKKLETRPIQNVQSGLQGLVPGVTITSTNGAPGMDGGVIRMRGTGTLNNSTPYILVDGIETGSLSDLDPNDIASISFLKDAASASIYGSKASNGVILITTKKGKDGKPTVAYNASFSIQNPTFLMDRLSSYDYATLYNEALKSEKKAPAFSEEEMEKFKAGNDPDYPNTDWYDLAFRTGTMQRHNVNVSGGTDNVRYMSSVGYLKQKGVLPNAGREQINGRTNLSMKINNRLTTRLNLAYTKNKFTDASSAYYGGSSDQLLRQLNLIAPWIVARYPNGTWGTISDGNPIAWLDEGIKVKRDNRTFVGQMAADYKILEGLTATVNASLVSADRYYNYFQPYFRYNENKTTEPNFLEEKSWKRDKKTFEALLNYEQTFAENHNLHGLLGWHAESFNQRYGKMYRKNFPNNILTDMDAGDEATQTNNGNTRELNMLSWFGRVNYDFAGKYLLEANIRADASSRFADGHRWGYFPSFSAGWRLSEETFMQGCKSVLTDLKLRGSWGQLGNQNALSEFYPTVNVYNIDAKYIFDGALNSGYYQGSAKLQSLSWEKSTTWGFGMDFAILNKLNGSIDYYNRKTSDIIMQVNAPAEFALSAYMDNIGAMRNQGIELSLEYHDKWGEVEFMAAGNVAYNKNEVIQLTPGTDYIDRGVQRIAEGKEFMAYYLYKSDGLFQSDEEAKEFQKKYGNPFKGGDFKAGDIKYVDTNGDGKLNAEDRVYCNSTEPAWTYGLNLGAQYKGWDVSLFFNGAAKMARFYDQYEVYGSLSGDAAHPSTIWNDHWSPNNRDAKMPRLFTDMNSPSCSRRAASDFWLQNTNYLRLKNLQVGYTFPKNWIEPLNIKKLRVYYSVENLFTIDNIKANIDPEATSARLSSYPLLRTHALGVSLTF